MPFLECLNTSTIQTSSLPQKIEAAAAAGFRAIELWHVDVDAYCAEKPGSPADTITELRKRLRDAGLVVPSMISLKGWCDPRADATSPAWDECKRRMEKARELGCPLCVAGPPLGEVPFDFAVDHYAKLVDVASTIGIRAAFEFLGFAAQFKTIEMAVELIRATQNPAACLVVDPFHLHRGGSGIEGFTRANLVASEIGILHFNDVPCEPPAEVQTDADRVMPGDGIFRLADYLKAAAAAGYTGALSLELFRPDLWQQDPIEVARRGFFVMAAACIENNPSIL